MMLLSLPDHTQSTIVNYHNLYRQIIFTDGSQFLYIHLETAITGNINDQFSFPAHLGTNGSRQAKTHCSQTAGSDKIPRIGIIIILGSPHLMLANFGNYNCLSPGQSVQFLNDCLWSVTIRVCCVNYQSIEWRANE